jgi:uncharacterized membrane protein YhiD involved in acid resistance
MILPALATTVMMFFVLVLLQLAERAIVPRSSSSTQHLQIESPSVSGQFIATIYDICTRNKISIEKLHLHAEQERDIYLISKYPRFYSQYDLCLSHPGHKRHMRYHY